MKISKQSNKGFTLIELLVVVSIISLLSSIVLATLKDARNKAKGRAFREHVDQFIYAIELYKSNHDGKLPFPSNATIPIFYRTGSGNEFGHTSLDDILKNEGLISSAPYPPFPQTTWPRSYFFFGIHNSTNCGPGAKFNNRTEEYQIWITGNENIKYFSDWPDLYNANFAGEVRESRYKCFSIK